MHDSPIGRQLGVSVSAASMVSGLVGEMSFQVLPSISPPVTFLLTIAAMLVIAFEAAVDQKISPLKIEI